MKARVFDEKFDAGEDVSQYLDLKKARCPGHAPKRLGVPRQSLIKMVIAHHPDKEQAS